MTLQHHDDDSLICTIVARKHPSTQVNDKAFFPILSGENVGCSFIIVRKREFFSKIPFRSVRSGSALASGLKLLYFARVMRTQLRH